MTFEPGIGRAPSALASLRRYVRPRVAIVREHCSLCNVELADEHPHLVEIATRGLVCSCDACALLFSGPAARYRRVPRAIRFLDDFRLADATWDRLGIPIDLAFFLNSTAAGGIIAVYPSPAGATETPVSPLAWEALTAENPGIVDIEPDVESLLVNRVGGASVCYRVGIDECYRLVGLIRTQWRGLSGGTEVWDAIGQFFQSLREHSR